jgi:hypothetical protein
MLRYPCIAQRASSRPSAALSPSQAPPDRMRLPSYVASAAASRCIMAAAHFIGVTGELR